MTAKKHFKQNKEAKKLTPAAKKAAMGTASVLLGAGLMGNARPVKKVIGAKHEDEIGLVVKAATLDDSEENKDVIAPTEQGDQEQVASDDQGSNESVEQVETQNETDGQTFSEEEANQETKTENQEVVDQATSKENQTQTVDADKEDKETSNPVETERTKTDQAKVDEINQTNQAKIDAIIKEAEAAGIKVTTTGSVYEIQTSSGKIEIDQAKLEAYTQEQIDKIAAAIKAHQQYLKEKEEHDKLWGGVDSTNLPGKQELVLGNEDATLNVSLNSWWVYEGYGDELDGKLENKLNTFIGVYKPEHYGDNTSDPLPIEEDLFTAIYTDLKNSTYNGKPISRIEITYSNWIPYKDVQGLYGIYIGKNPIDGFFYNGAQSVDVAIKFYDANGNLIELKDDTAFITVGSLNSKGEGQDYVEKAEILDDTGEGLHIKGSSVNVHKNETSGNDVLYADKANEWFYDLKKDELTDEERAEAEAVWGKESVDKFLSWDESTPRPDNEYFGSGLFKVKGAIVKLRFSNGIGSAWATFNATIPTVDVPAGPQEPETNIEYTPGKLVLVTETTPTPDPEPTPVPDPEPTPAEDETDIPPHPEEEPGAEYPEQVEEKNEEKTKDNSQSEVISTSVKATDVDKPTLNTVSTEKTSETVEKKESEEATLPETGQDHKTSAAIAGAIAAALGLTSLAGTKKRKKKSE